MTDVRQALEYPLPVLTVGIQELIIEARSEDSGHEESFLIRNTGGGMLEGRIISPDNCLTFKPAKWHGNRQEVICRFLPDAAENWKPGDVREFKVLILSNGGEACLTVIIRLAKMAIATLEGVSVANLKDFYNYAINFPSEAQKLFEDRQFETLLLATDFPYIDAYTLLVKEPNRPRAIDNFFILAGLKKRTALSVLGAGPSGNHEIEYRTLSNAIIRGQFELQKSDGGYVEADIGTATGAAWLSLALEDFIVKYSIDPLLITGRCARERVTISGNGEELYVDIVFKRPKPMLAWLLREGFRFQDEGKIAVENQTSDPLQVEVFCKESFVRFYRRQYKVEGRIDIPFIIKLSPLQSAQMLFRKVPSLSAEIELRATYKDTVINKVLTLTAGEW